MKIKRRRKNNNLGVSSIWQVQEGTRHHTASACVDSQPLTKYAEQEQHVHLGNMKIKPLACPFSQLTSPWESNHFTGLTFCVQEATQSPQDRYNVARWMLQHSTCYCWGGVGAVSYTHLTLPTRR